MEVEELFADLPEKFPGFGATDLDSLGDIEVLQSALMRAVEIIMDYKKIKHGSPPGSWQRHVICHHIYEQVVQDNIEMKARMAWYMENGTGLLRDRDGKTITE